MVRIFDKGMGLLGWIKSRIQNRNKSDPFGEIAKRSETPNDYPLESGEKLDPEDVDLSDVDLSESNDCPECGFVLKQSEGVRVCDECGYVAPVE